MSKKLSEYITVTKGVENKNYRINDDALLFVNGISKFKTSKKCSFIYYVVGGGANGSKGSNESTVGRGGGGGDVQFGRVIFEPNVEYRVEIKPTLPNGNGQSAGFSSSDTKIEITANGGKINGTGGDNTGKDTGGKGVIKHTGAFSPATGQPGYGNGGISPAAGGIAGKAGTSESKNGGNGVNYGSGGGGGYGSTGSGGEGVNGSVLLIDVDNSNMVQHIEKQLRELNQLPGSMVDQYNQQYNATMMAGALWTVLATSLVFYVFTQV